MADSSVLEIFGDFDIAFTYEDIGELDRESTSNKITVISQRAREAFESVGVKIDGYGIVTLKLVLKLDEKKIID